MAHIFNRRPGACEASYYEAEKEVVRGPCDSYSSEYRAQEYANPGYSTGYNRHNNGGYAAGVTEVVYESVAPSMGHHHHHHGGVTEVIERREDIAYDSTCDPSYRRMC